MNESHLEDLGRRSEGLSGFAVRCPRLSSPFDNIITVVRSGRFTPTVPFTEPVVLFKGRCELVEFCLAIA